MFSKLGAARAILSKRHLRHRAGDFTLCGLTSQNVVHVSKARKTDCSRCRAEYRYEIKQRRAESYLTAARQAHGDPLAHNLVKAAEKLERANIAAIAATTTAALFCRLFDIARELERRGFASFIIAERIRAGLATTEPGRLPAERKR